MDGKLARCELSRVRKIYPGYYKTSCNTVIEKAGKESTHVAEIEIRHMPEWRGSDKWAVTITAQYAGHSVQLAELSDIVAPTKRAVMQSAESACRAGFRWSTGPGWAFWATRADK